MVVFAQRAEEKSCLSSAEAEAEVGSCCRSHTAGAVRDRAFRFGIQDPLYTCRRMEGWADWADDGVGFRGEGVACGCSCTSRRALGNE